IKGQDQPIKHLLGGHVNLSRSRLELVSKLQAVKDHNTMAAKPLIRPATFSDIRALAETDISAGINQLRHSHTQTRRLFLAGCDTVIAVCADGPRSDATLHLLVVAVDGKQINTKLFPSPHTLECNLRHCVAANYITFAESESDSVAVGTSPISAANFSIPGRKLGEELFDLERDIAHGEPDGPPSGKLRLQLEERLANGYIWLAELNGRVVGSIAWHDPLSDAAHGYRPGEVTS
ncbi:hypothetical protein C8R45DRAFT_1138580, partial [Mycena sanguinolenta]